jgi:hypothetical protein
MISKMQMNEKETLRRKIAELENLNMQDRNTLQIVPLTEDKISEIKQRIRSRETELKLRREKKDQLS